jgi:hypothetical protein
MLFCSRFLRSDEYTRLHDNVKVEDSIAVSVVRTSRQ